MTSFLILHASNIKFFITVVLHWKQVTSYEINAVNTTKYIVYVICLVDLIA